MKKIILLHQMEVFIKHTGRFTLAQLMQEFHISRSTALRYIASLEELGVPIYSEQGRYGGYVIADSYRIAPVRFSEEEIHAILFALDGLEVLKSSPFKSHFSNISTKLLQVLSKQSYQTYERMQKHLQIRNTTQIYHAKHLEQLLQAILQRVFLRIHMNKHTHVIKPLALWFQSGKWLLAVFDTGIHDLRVFRCDLIDKIEITQLPEAVLQTLPDFQPIHLGNFNELRQEPQQAHFAITIRKEGMPLFYSKSFPQMVLSELEEHAVITGRYNAEEMDYLLDYCNRFYRHLIDIEPASLKQQLIGLTKTHLHHLET